jgi:hypothetical protein
MKYEITAFIRIWRSLIAKARGPVLCEGRGEIPIADPIMRYHKYTTE